MCTYTTQNPRATTGIFFFKSMCLVGFVLIEQECSLGIILSEIAVSPIDPFTPQIFYYVPSLSMSLSQVP